MPKQAEITDIQLLNDWIDHRVDQNTGLFQATLIQAKATLLLAQEAGRIADAIEELNSANEHAANTDLYMPSP